MKRLTCLHCFETFMPNEIEFRCLYSHPSFCEMEIDEKLQRFLGLTVGEKRPRVVKPKRWRGMRTETRCSCGSRTKPICPACHNDLHHQFGMAKNCIVALIGASESGKTHYITALIHDLIGRIGNLFGASVTALDDQTIIRYQRDFERYIYVKRQTIPRTASARVRIDVRSPLVYRLNLDTRRLRYIKSSNVVNLVFFDTAGEDLANIDTMSTEARYIANADGLIFLLDPLQIPTVRELIPSSIPLPSENVDQAEIIERATRLVQNVLRMVPREKIEIPVAITFSKIDALRTIVDPLLMRASQHNGYLDLTDVNTVNDLFCAYVEKWVGPNMVIFLRQAFKQFSFFGASALGGSPDGMGNLSRGVSPYRIEDPFLWILYKKGLIPGRTT